MTKLKKGSKGADVKSLQEQLNKAGAKPKLKVDGGFGAKTEEALKQFQKKNRLKDDGVAGAKTMATLEKKAGGGAAEKAPEWPHGDYVKMVKAIESNTKDIVDTAKKNLMAMDRHLDDFDIEKMRNTYFDNLRSYLASHKKWMTEAKKVIQFQKSFEKLAARNPKAGPEIIKAADKTIKNMEQISNASDKYLLENMDIADDFQKMTTKKAA